MSHLHVSDGILPLWLWLGGLIVSLAIVVLGLYRLKSRRRLLPAVAVMAALSMAAMNIPLGLPVHVNLAALAGIVLGPLNGFLAMFVVNLFNALVGHGGITVLGVNALLVGSEALIAGAVFYGLKGAKRLLPVAAAAIIIALLASTLLLTATAGVVGQELEAMVAHGHQHGGEQVVESRTGFLATFGALLALPLAVWLAVELTVSLFAINYVNKVRGGWFTKGDDQ